MVQVKLTGLEGLEQELPAVSGATCHINSRYWAKGSAQAEPQRLLQHHLQLMPLPVQAVLRRLSRRPAASAAVRDRAAGAELGGGGSAAAGGSLSAGSSSRGSCGQKQDALRRRQRCKERGSSCCCTSPGVREFDAQLCRAAGG